VLLKSVKPCGLAFAGEVFCTMYITLYTHRHPFNCPFSGTTRVSRYQKGKTCLEWGADLYRAQLMPLPLTDSCFSKIQIGFTFLVPAQPGSPGQRAVKQVCVCCQCSSNLLDLAILYKFSFYYHAALCADAVRVVVIVLVASIQSELMSQNLHSRYVRHFVGTTWRNVLS